MIVASHTAVLLAAGASTRLGRPKQLIEIAGETLLHRVARALLATSPSELVVVLGHDAERMQSAIDDLPLRVVIASDYASGMSASLRVGIAAIDGDSAGALIALTDQPALDLPHLLALRDAWRAAPARAIASAYAGVRGVPAILPRAWFADIARLHGDAGARELLRARDVTAIGAPALATDIDRPEDLR